MDFKLYGYTVNPVRHCETLDRLMEVLQQKEQGYFCKCDIHNG